MSTSTKVNVNTDELKKIMAEAAPDVRLRFAKMVRASYVKSVGNTEIELDPARLRTLDANIAKLEASIN